MIPFTKADNDRKGVRVRTVRNALSHSLDYQGHCAGALFVATVASCYVGYHGHFRVVACGFRLPAKGRRRATISTLFYRYSAVRDLNGLGR